MTKRTNTCLWCGVIAPTASAHMIHVHEEHPETFGRGRTMSREWSCECGAENRPVTHRCHGCERTNGTVARSNAERTFVVWHRMTPADTPTISEPMSHADAVRMAARFHTWCWQRGIESEWNDRRLEDWFGGRRITWLEVAEVTAGIFYRPPLRR